MLGRGEMRWSNTTEQRYKCKTAFLRCCKHSSSYRTNKHNYSTQGYFINFFFFLNDVKAGNVNMYTLLPFKPFSWQLLCPFYLNLSSKREFLFIFINLTFQELLKWVYLHSITFQTCDAVTSTIFRSFSILSFFKIITIVNTFMHQLKKKKSILNSNINLGCNLPCSAPSHYKRWGTCTAPLPLMQSQNQTFSAFSY